MKVRYIMSNNLIVCMSRGIIFYPLAYALEFGDGRKFDLVIANGQKLPLQVCEYLTSIGINVIDLELASPPTIHLHKNLAWYGGAYFA